MALNDPRSAYRAQVSVQFRVGLLCEPAESCICIEDLKSCDGTGRKIHFRFGGFGSGGNGHADPHLRGGMIDPFRVVVRMIRRFP